MMEGKKALEQHFYYQSLADYLPYESYDEVSGIFINRRSYGFIIETGVFTGYSEELERELSGLFRSILPEGSSIQFLMVAGNKTGDILDKWEAARKSASNILYELAKQRKKFFIAKSEAGSMLRNFRLIISCSISGFNPTEIELRRFRDLRSQVETIFAASGVWTQVLKPDDLIRLLDEVLNYDGSTKNSSLEWNRYQPIREQILSPCSKRTVTKDSIILNDGEWEYRNYSVKKYPNHYYLGAMANLIGDVLRDTLRIPCTFIIHYGVYIEKSKTRKAALFAKGARVEAQALSPLGKWVPSLMREAKEHMFVREQLEDERWVKTYYQVTLIDKPERINSSESLLETLYRSNGWELSLNRLIVMSSLYNILPLSWGEGIESDMSFFRKCKTTKSHEPVNILPVQGEFKGTDNPGMLLSGRRGQIAYWYPFDNRSGNFNVCVVGKPGSGKSVFMQELATSIMGLGGRAYVLDVGRSFEKQANFIGGQFIEFSTSSNLCLNPFSSIDDKSEENIIDSLSILKPIVSLMIAPKGGTHDNEDAIIERGLYGIWKQKGKQAGIGDLAEWLLNEKDNIANNLGKMLFPYTKEGAYGRFFNGRANIDFSSRFVVAELQELKERKDLQSVVVQIFMLLITNRIILSDRKTPSAIIFDEAWDLLRGKQGGEFIEALARTLRKFNGALVVGTQTVNDFYASPGAEAAFNNSDWLCMFAQKKESIELLKKNGRFMTDDYTQKLLSTVKTKQGEYAEVMIMHENGSAIMRLILDPFSRILYSTKAEEYAAVKTLQAQGMSLPEAIHQVSKERYRDAV